MVALLFGQRFDFRLKMRNLHRGICCAASVVEREVCSESINNGNIAIVARMLRETANIAREFISAKDVDPKFARSLNGTEFDRIAILGATVPIDCRIVEPCEWDSGIVRAIVELPAKLHERDAIITSLKLDRFRHNPVVMDHADFGQSMPIGQADAELEEDGVSLEIGLAIGVNDRAAQMRDELRSGRFSLCAYVRVSGVAMTVLAAGVCNRLLCNGELVAIQPYLTSTKPAYYGGEPK